MRIPNRCPICLGTGNVPGGFYNCCPGGTPTSCNTSELCRSCHGSGVIYTEGQEPVILDEGPGYKISYTYPAGPDLAKVIELLQDIKRILSSKSRHV